MESIKPSFDVVLQAGLHRGIYSRNFYKRRRPKTSKTTSDRAGRRGQDSSLKTGMGEDDDEGRHLGDWRSSPATSRRDSEKRKTYGREADREARRVADFNDRSPSYDYKALETGHGSRVKAGATPDSSNSLSSIVMRASRLSTDHFDDTGSSYATLPPLSHYRHFPGSAIISVDELPRPQRGTYRVEAVQTNEPSHHGVQPISLHDDELMAYAREAESTANDFTLDALIAGSRQQHQHQRMHSVSAAPMGNVDDDEIGQLYHLLDNPFTGHDYQRTLSKQQVLVQYIYVQFCSRCTAGLMRHVQGGPK